MKKLNGIKDQVIDAPSEPLDLSGCINVTINSPNIVGGEHNICMTGCINCKVVGGILSNPTGTSSNSDDPEGHNIIFDKCNGCSISKTQCNGTTPRGDAINIFNSRNCIVSSCVINGPLAKYGTAAIIDGPSGLSNTISGLIVNSPKGRISICGGKGHILQDFTCSGPIEITGEYYKNGKVTNAKIIRVNGPEIYINVATVVGLNMNKCHFRVVNKS